MSGIARTALIEIALPADLTGNDIRWNVFDRLPCNEMPVRPSKKAISGVNVSETARSSVITLTAAMKPQGKAAKMTANAQVVSNMLLQTPTLDDFFVSIV